jgi:hypothetical protein
MAPRRGFRKTDRRDLLTQAVEAVKKSVHHQDKKTQSAYNKGPSQCLCASVVNSFTASLAWSGRAGWGAPLELKACTYGTPGVQPKIWVPISPAGEG